MHNALNTKKATAGVFSLLIQNENTSYHFLCRVSSSEIVEGVNNINTF